MAEVTLLHQEISLLKIRVSALTVKNQEFSVELDTAVSRLHSALSENTAQYQENLELQKKIAEQDARYSRLEWTNLASDTKYCKALRKIEQLEEQLLDAYGTQSSNTE